MLPPLPPLWQAPETHPGVCCQVAEEARAVEEVCRQLCPIQVSLDRVLITPTGVVLAAWQVGPTRWDGPLSDS